MSINHTWLSTRFCQINIESLIINNLINGLSDHFVHYSLWFIINCKATRSCDNGSTHFPLREQQPGVEHGSGRTRVRPPAAALAVEEAWKAMGKP